MEKEEILINLKVIQGIQANQKIISRSQYLNIEYESIVPVSWRRRIRQDNRQMMLNKIRLVLNTALEKTDDDEINQYLQGSIKGLSNLKETYISCSQTCAQLDVFIDSINNINKETSPL